MSSAVEHGEVSILRQKKRPRVSEGDSDPTTIKRSKNYWFDDGNIILRVEDTLFRLHRGMLSRHSAVFNDMFALPQPEIPDDEGLVEGCIVVDLPGDKVRDWDRVLAVLCDFDTSYRKQDDLPAGPLASMLRLGRKYQFDGIFKESFERIQEVIPTTLKEWNGLPKVFLDGNIARAYVLLNVLLEIGNQTLLPVVYYCCAAYTGTTYAFSVCRAMDPDDKSASALTEKIIKGREKLTNLTAKVLLEWAFLPINSNFNRCASPVACANTKQARVKTLLSRPHPSLALASGSAVVSTIGANAICPMCTHDITMAHNRSREQVWEQLPSLFDLPPWNDLKNL